MTWLLDTNVNMFGAGRLSLIEWNACRRFLTWYDQNGRIPRSR